MIELYKQYLLERSQSLLAIDKHIGVKGFLHEYKNFGHSIEDACDKMYNYIKTINNDTTNNGDILSYDQFISQQRDSKLNELLK